MRRTLRISERWPSTSSSQTCIRSRRRLRNRTSGSRKRLRTSISVASRSSVRRQKMRTASASSSDPRGTPKSYARCGNRRRYPRSSGTNSRSRRSGTRPDTMPRSSISLPGVKGTSSRRHSGSRMTRLRTSATGRTRIKRQRSTGSRSRRPRRRPRTSCKGRSSPTTT